MLTDFCQMFWLAGGFEGHQHADHKYTSLHDNYDIYSSFLLGLNNAKNDNIPTQRTTIFIIVMLAHMLLSPHVKLLPFFKT